jgi:hypothetical protein
MMIIDLPCDRGFVRFSRLTKSLPELPAFVKEASTEDCSGSAELTSSAYADAINRKFPIHTKAAAFLSYLYFQDQKHKFPKEAQARINSRFDYAANMWGIRTEMKLADKALEPKTEKQAGADAYALSAAGQFFFPIDTPVNIVKSAADLVECRKNFTYDMRKEAATNIMKAGLENGIPTLDMPEELHRMAGFGFCEKEAVVKNIQRRKNYATGSRSPLAAQMSKLAEDVQNADGIPPEQAVKIAEVVDIFDREIGIANQYGDTFDFPEDVLFGAFTEKTAAHIKKSTISMITGTTYTHDQLSKAADALRVFGDDFYSDVVRGDGSVDLAQVSDVLPTMPRDEAALFDRAMESL